MPTLIRPGQVFGSLIAVREAPREKRCIRWVFRCVCSMEVVRAKSTVLRALSKDGQNTSCCRRCQIARHAKWMRDNRQGERRLVGLVGERRAHDLLHPVDIDRELPKVFG